MTKLVLTTEESACFQKASENAGGDIRRVGLAVTTAMIGLEIDPVRSRQVHRELEDRLRIQISGVAAQKEKDDISFERAVAATMEPSHPTRKKQKPNWYNLRDARRNQFRQAKLGACEEDED